MEKQKWQLDQNTIEFISTLQCAQYSLKLIQTIKSYYVWIWSKQESGQVSYHISHFGMIGEELEHLDPSLGPVVHQLCDLEQITVPVFTAFLCL